MISLWFKLSRAVSGFSPDCVMIYSAFSGSVILNIMIKVPIEYFFVTET